MHPLAVQISITTASPLSPVCSSKHLFIRQRSFSQKTLAASFDILRWSAERQFSARASSADATAQIAKAPITFQVGETSLTLPFSAKAAEGLSKSIDKLLTTFKEREKATRPQRWQNMEYRQKGDDGVSFEFFCNPNAYANAFQAKVLITVNDEKIKVATEGQLSALKSDVDQYVEQIRYGSP